MLADEVGRQHHAARNAQRAQYLQRQRKVIPGIRVARHGSSLTLEVPPSRVKQTARRHTPPVTAITIPKLIIPKLVILTRRVRISVYFVFSVASLAPGPQNYLCVLSFSL